MVPEYLSLKGSREITDYEGGTFQVKFHQDVILIIIETRPL